LTETESNHAYSFVAVHLNTSTILYLVVIIFIAKGNNISVGKISIGKIFVFVKLDSRISIKRLLTESKLSGDKTRQSLPIQTKLFDNKIRKFLFYISE
jgi:hypothetical protein